MDFSQTQRDPTRKFVGIGAVVVFHIIIVYALVTGLARKVVEVVKGPIEVKVIEEIIKKPPPPPELLPPPPKLQAPPPPFIPPPEINIAPPPTPGPTITAVTPEAPPAPTAPVIAPPAPTPTPAPVAPAVQSATLVCPNYREALQMAYPREAALGGIQGDVLTEFTVGANGQIRDIVIKSSSNRIFNRPVTQAVQTLTCKGQGQDIRVQLPFTFKLN